MIKAIEQPKASRQDTEPQWIRPAQWMALTNMTHSQTYRALWSGQLKAARVGSAWYVDADEVSNFFERNAENVA